MRVRTFTLLILLLWSASLAGAVDIPLDQAPTRGPADAPVTIIEFMDFQ